LHCTAIEIVNATHDDDNEIQFTVLVQKIPSPPSTIEGGDGSLERQGRPCRSSE